jgi:hypothetical protein
MTIAVAICARNPAALTLHVITMDYRETWPHALLIKRDALNDSWSQQAQVSQGQEAISTQGAS